MKKQDLLKELQQVDKKISALDARKKEIKKQLRLTEQKENLKISLTISRNKYFLGKARIGKKVVSCYVGRISDYENEQDALEKAKFLFQKRIAENRINNIFGDKSSSMEEV